MADNVNNNEELARLLKLFASRNPADRGVQAAQREFYEYLVKGLERHVLTQVMFNEDVAQAALQNAWLKIFMTAHTYDPKLASVKTWAKKIGEQCAIDELRRFYSQQEKIVDIEKHGQDDDEQGELSGLDGFACNLPGPEEELEAKQVQQAIVQCIERLPKGKGPNYRLAMKLSLENELNYKQMKDILSAQSPRYQDLNDEQVRKWVRKAAERMKGCITAKLGRLGKGGMK